MQGEVKEQALRWFVRLQDVSATEADWSAFQAWQDASPDHGRAYRLLDQTWAAVDHAEALLGAANDQTPPADTAHRTRRPLRRTWLAGAVGIAATLALTVGLWPQMTGVGALQTYHAAETPLNVALADGSHLYLNRGTDVSVRIGRRERAVSLDRGEAGFDVRHEPARPFVVTAGRRTVSVLGTAFNIVRDDDRFRVSVARGLVAVTTPGQDRPAHLGAGQQLDQAGSGPVELSRIVPEQAVAWRQGVLIYQDRPLSEVAADLSRYLGKPVQVDPAAERIRFTGSLRVGDEQTMLGKIGDYLPVVVVRSPDRVRISARAPQ
ncbi:FecR domain-containing protein [soil metagenome]